MGKDKINVDSNIKFCYNKNIQKEFLMAYIGKVSVTSAWAKLEDLIQAQVDGQSSFSFSTSNTYQLQADSELHAPFGVRVCNSASEPSNDDDGEHLTDEQSGEYKPESGVYLWVKTRGNTTGIKLSVSEIA